MMLDNASSEMCRLGFVIHQLSVQALTVVSIVDLRGAFRYV
jgi:hypothetical protein